MGRMTRARSTLPLVVAALAVPAAVGAQTPDYPLPSPAAPQAEPTPAPAPVAQRRALIARVSGRVLYKPLGTKRYRRLTRPRDLAFGAAVDARKGRVGVTVERSADGPRSSAVFFSGKFVLEDQAGSPLVTTLRLIGGSFVDSCAPRAGASRVPAKDPQRKVRRLWGDGKGRFRTRGRYSAATVRGTKWLVEDRCAGTVTRVARGEVEVEDFTVPESRPPTRDGGDTQVVEEGGGEKPAAAPAPAMGEGSEPKRRVRVSSGGSYTAGPR